MVAAVISLKLHLVRHALIPSIPTYAIFGVDIWVKGLRATSMLYHAISEIRSSSSCCLISEVGMMTTGEIYEVYLSEVNGVTYR
ncbi:hypothetical protein SAMN04488518_1392 [Pseudovibrio ascidiaceicola]|uniref:Secreted protein n=1 Tax=Pseudovibrio ascidiaceicola TaxID=285279 RepID=A0A1I4GA94_9HYPH|nr:hypothetical protein SAMN04488518_1392 [Pseudovibrio ascidiaceicola]